jgi:hypothetical protein
MTPSYTTATELPRFSHSYKKYSVNVLCKRKSEGECLSFINGAYKRGRGPKARKNKYHKPRITSI